MKQPQNSQPQQYPSYHRTQALPARIGLLHHHHPGQQGHRPQAAHSQTEHRQHQRPAAPQAKHPMAQPQPPGRSYPFAVGAHEESERATALLETASLERAELEHPRESEGGRANDPGMGVEPEPVMQEPMDLAISQKRHERECRPDNGIASQERSWDGIWASLLPTSMHDHRDPRHAP